MSDLANAVLRYATAVAESDEAVRAGREPVEGAVLGWMRAVRDRVIVELAFDPHGDQDLIDGATLMAIHLLSPAGGGGWNPG